jgi:indoleamine 2,3-dioxygenase
MFLMGSMNPEIFPKGVIYQGVDTKPMVYRGPSGAYDSILPTMDALLEMSMSPPRMTEELKIMLADFITYKPINHQ